MLLTALALTLCASVGDASAAVRLVTDAPRSEVSLVPAEQLEADLRALRGIRVSIGGAVALVAVGSVTTVVGLFFIGVAAAMSQLFFGNAVVMIAMLLFTSGIPSLAGGAWWLGERLEERRRVREVTQDLQHQLEFAYRLPDAMRF